MIGTVIFSQYQILDRIGEGLFGTVYRARDLDLDRVVALRIVPIHRLSAPEDRRRLAREAEILATFTSSQIAAVYATGETEDGSLFVAAAFCAGETLARRLERGPLKPAAAVDVAAQIAAGLAVAHDRGLVHRNLRPSNIFLAANGEVKIADFGFPGAVEETLRTRAEPPSSAAYLAPEQLQGRPGDTLSDLWSVGAMLYEMILGRRPGEPPLPGAPGSALPAGLEQVVARALADQPAERFSDAEALWRSLHALRRGSGSGPLPATGEATTVSRLLGPYQLMERIGGGGMGIVYRALDTRLDRFVAVKLLPPELARDPTAKARFRQEARAASALDHPNLCTIHEVGETAEGQLYLVMPCYEGETLRRRIGDGPLPVLEAVDLAVQVARGLAKAHRRGIIHRDIKPANLMLTSDGVVKILDFGIAKLAGEAGLTQQGRAVGTPAYMSPEQMRGEEVDARTDLWSLGVVLYEMLAGRRPFPGEHESVIRQTVLFNAPEPLTRLRPELSHEIDRVVGRLLSKDAAGRYPGAEDVVADLRAPGAAGSNAAWPQSSPGQPSLRRRRTRLWGAAGAGLALAGLALLGGYTLRSREETATVRARFSRLTDQGGRESFPSLSPNGNYFVYVKSTQDNADVYLQRIGGGKSIDLTPDSPADDTQPAFSPDGSLIAFRSERDGGGIFLMGATGESVRRVTDSGYNPAWSPDGREIAMATSGISDPWARSGISEIWIVELATGRKRRLVAGDGVQPSWSPSGRRIAYWGVPAGSGRRALWTIPASGGEAVPVVDDTQTNWNPVWSPDGRYLYFSSDRGGSMNLWRVPIDEATGKVLGEPAPLTTPAPWSGLLSLSADGRQIAYSSSESRSNLERTAFDAARLRANGPPVPITEGSRMVRAADVSPDGRQIAFFSSAPQEDLFVARVDGSGLRQITNDAAKDRSPKWSPDGSRILFYSDRSGKYEAWSIRPDGSGIEQLTRSPDLAVAYSIWSPDGRRICATLASKGSALIDLAAAIEQRTPRLLPTVRNAKTLFATSWSPDGRRLAGTDPGQGVGVFQLDGLRYSRLTEHGGVPVWLNDNRTLLFLDHGSVLSLDTVTGRESRVLAPPLYSSYSALAVSRDNRTLYLTRFVDEADIWLLTLE